LADSLPQLLSEQERRRKNKIARMFPETGPFRAELYPKHMRYIETGRTHRERLFLAANQVGKTELGAYELTCHLTGKYPPNWPGRKFPSPIDTWAAGDTSKTVKDILQSKLLGPFGDFGTGMIPAHLIGKVVAKAGVAEAIDAIYVQHVAGSYSKVTLKSYDQRRESFQGTAMHVVWLDEEPPLDIYIECLMRTITTGGMVMLTFTPLSGLTEVVTQFLPGGKIQEREGGDPSAKAVVMATWDDVPHLTKEAKEQLWNSIPPFQRDARSKGVPQLGSGAIYPIPEEDVVCAPFEIPKHWPRAYGLDVGWNRTAAVWGARNPDTGVTYLYSEHYRGQAEPSVNAEAIRSRGAWIPGVIDPAARGRGQADGRQMLQLYIDQGLSLATADNGVETGLYEVWQALSAGKLKVFSTLGSWLEEFRIYRRDDTGKVVKEKDHLQDATRYLQVSGMDRAMTEPIARPLALSSRYSETSWMS
jgi:phage terminase large subunit-like protein